MIGSAARIGRCLRVCYEPGLHERVVSGRRALYDVAKTDTRERWAHRGASEGRCKAKPRGYQHKAIFGSAREFPADTTAN